MDFYKKHLISNVDKTREYYMKSIVKTEQQKMLEFLLERDDGFINSINIADIATGGGTLSYHLGKINKNANFTLIDYMEESISISKEINRNNLDRFIIKKGDIYIILIVMMILLILFFVGQPFLG